MKKGQIFSKSYAGQLLRMRKIEEVGTLVDHIANEGFTSAKRVYEEFGIDFKTIKALRCCQPSVSGDTLGKFAYVIAFYLDLARKEAEGIKYIIDKEERLAEVHRLTEDFKAIYGIVATCVLEQIKQHKDLRQVVRQEQNS